MRSGFALLVLFAAGGRAQSPPKPAPKFEVASIKLSDCDFSKIAGGGQSPGRLNRKCAHLRALIQQAYGRYGFNPLREQVTGGPGWLDSDFYDIVAKAARTPSMEQMAGPMMQALLEDRFALKIHRETREVPVYDLTAAKGSTKLTPAKPGSCIVPDPGHPPGPPIPGLPLRLCGGRYGIAHGFEMYGATIANLCDALSFMMDRDVIDKTGIRGKFDIRLEIDPGDAIVPAAGSRAGEPALPAAPDPQSIVAGFLRDMQKMNDGAMAPALQQRLGLKIVPGKGPGETIVIDHIERPTEN